MLQKCHECDPIFNNKNLSDRNNRSYAGSNALNNTNQNWTFRLRQILGRFLYAHVLHISELLAWFHLQLGKSMIRYQISVNEIYLAHIGSYRLWKRRDTDLDRGRTSMGDFSSKVSCYDCMNCDPWVWRLVGGAWTWCDIKDLLSDIKRITACSYARETEKSAEAFVSGGRGSPHAY